MTVDNATGRLNLYARSIGGVQFTNLHAGFGLILRSDHQTTAIGASLRRMGFQWQVGAVHALAQASERRHIRGRSPVRIGPRGRLGSENADVHDETRRRIHVQCGGLIQRT